MKASKKVGVARKFIHDFFSDCNGALMLKSSQDHFFEILLFYNHMNFYHQNVFQYHRWEISIKIFHTSSCYNLLRSNECSLKMVKGFSTGTIIKDHDYEIEILQLEAQIILENNQVY